MSQPIIQVANVSKLYRLGHRNAHHVMFRDALRAMITAPFHRLMHPRASRDNEDQFLALNNVSFDIQKGEVVGVIGRNGAGKSTLLKILSRITEPSEGEIRLRGRVASLLEVGTGFHAELTGRENVFLNGAILGMTKAEISRKFDEIVAFAEIEKFLETPVKYYSSGMYVRLAFAVAAHLEPEILIVDEVLAVGDAEFQKKCLGKMGEVSKIEGRTILFVSHNMAAVRQLTSRCILFDKGKITFDGEPERAIELYSSAASGGFVQGANLSNWPRWSTDLRREVEIKALSFDRRNPVYRSDEPISFAIVARAGESVERLRVSGTIFHLDGTAVGTFFSDDDRSMRSGEERILKVAIKNHSLAPGNYLFGLALGRGNETTGHKDFDVLLDVLPFEIAAIDGDGGVVGAWPRGWGSIRFAAPSIETIAVD